MIDQTAYDNICHEHVTFLTLKNMQMLCATHGLRVISVERRAINGGSLRLYIQHQEKEVRGSVALWVQAEAGLYDRLQHFAHRVNERRQQLQDLLGAWARKDYRCDVYACSTKFNTLSQYCGLDHSIIRCGVERTPEKFGLKTVTGVPMISEDAWRTDPAPVTLLGAWQWRDQVVLRENAYLAQGGTLLMPLPHVEAIATEIAHA